MTVRNSKLANQQWNWIKSPSFICVGSETKT